MNDSSLDFFTRPACHLCEEARPAVVRAARLTGFRVREKDVDSDPELAVDWGLRIPVVATPEGRVLAEGRIELWPLLRRLIRMRMGLG